MPCRYDCIISPSDRSSLLVLVASSLIQKVTFLPPTPQFHLCALPPRTPPLHHHYLLQVSLILLNFTKLYSLTFCRNLFGTIFLLNTALSLSTALYPPSPFNLLTLLPLSLPSLSLFSPSRTFHQCLFVISHPTTLVYKYQPLTSVFDFS